jgi:hypothetical protein
VNRDDVGVIKIGDRASLGQIRLGILGMLDQMRVRDFDGDVTVKFLVACKVDTAKPASTQKPFNAITTHLTRKRLRLTTVLGRGFSLKALLRYIFWVGLVHTSSFIYSKTRNRDAPPQRDGFV